MASSSIDLAPLNRLVLQTLPAVRIKQIAAMPGGMSSRRFFRVELQEPTGGVPRSFVATFTPDARRSDEITHGKTHESSEWPFIEIQRTLANASVRVPRVWGQDCDAGWLLLEDLGDRTLAVALQETPEAKEALYRIAVHDLARAQAQLERLPEGSVISSRSFDEALLAWEIEHFREYALEARGIKLAPNQADTYTRLTHALATRVTNLPYGFVHRDYQSRNLMWVNKEASRATEPPNGELVWIDFQDALMGPRVYDLVALLNDSYQTFTRDFVEQRLREFTAERGLSEADVPIIIREFDIVTVQRKLKDAGRFVFFREKSGDDSYMRFVGPTIDKIKISLSRLQDEPLFQQWSELLDALV